MKKLLILLLLLSVGCSEKSIFPEVPKELKSIGRDWSNTSEGEVFKINGKYYLSCCGRLPEISKEVYNEKLKYWNEYYGI